MPKETATYRKDVISQLAKQGIGVASYFSPHLAEQPFFRDICVTGDLSNTDAVSLRALSLPMADQMTIEEVKKVCEGLMTVTGYG